MKFFLVFTDDTSTLYRPSSLHKVEEHLNLKQLKNIGVCHYLFALIILFQLSSNIFSFSIVISLNSRHPLQIRENHFICPAQQMTFVERIEQFAYTILLQQKTSLFAGKIVSWPGPPLTARNSGVQKVIPISNSQILLMRATY